MTFCIFNSDFSKFIQYFICIYELIPERSLISLNKIFIIWKIWKKKIIIKKRTLPCMPKFFEYKYLYHNFILLINTRDKPVSPSLWHLNWFLLGKFFAIFVLFSFGIICLCFGCLPCHCICVWLSTFFRLVLRPSPARQYVCFFVIIRSLVVWQRDVGVLDNRSSPAAWHRLLPHPSTTSQTPYEYGFFVLSVLLVNLLLFYAINPRLWKPLWRT